METKFCESGKSEIIYAHHLSVNDSPISRCPPRNSGNSIIVINNLYIASFGSQHSTSSSFLAYVVPILKKNLDNIAGVFDQTSSLSVIVFDATDNRQ